MTIHLTNPDKTVTIAGPKFVHQLLQELHLIPEAHLVIRKDELLTEDVRLDDSDIIEIRSVISGG